MFDQLKALLTLKRAKDQYERDTMNPNYEWTKSIKAGVLQILHLILAACLTAIVGVLSDSDTIKSILVNAGVNQAYVALILLGVAGGLRVLQNYRKHNPPTPGDSNAAPLAMIVFLLLPVFAFGQESPAPEPSPSLSPSPTPSPTPATDFDLAAYLRTHAYLTGGTFRTAGETRAVYELRFVDDFPISGDTYRGAARVSLFSLTRAGEQAPPQQGIPASIKDATSAYSDGEVWLSARKILKPWLAAECIGGVTFKMASLSGSVGNPLDGTKVGVGCGVRLTFQDNHLSIIPGSFGPVADGDKLLGPLPSVMASLYVPLAFLKIFGKHSAFTPDFAFGAAPPLPGDPDQRRQLTQSIRLLISSGF
jgi:hypothetical protein